MPTGNTLTFNTSQINKALADCPALGVGASGGVIREFLPKDSPNDVIQRGCTRKRVVVIYTDELPEHLKSSLTQEDNPPINYSADGTPGTPHLQDNLPLIDDSPPRSQTPPLLQDNLTQIDPPRAQTAPHLQDNFPLIDDSPSRAQTAPHLQDNFPLTDDSPPRSQSARAVSPSTHLAVCVRLC